MRLLFDAFWRAAAYCLHPRVIALSLLPLLLMSGLALGLGWWFWADAVDAVRQAFEHWALLDTLFLWLASVGLTGLKTALAPLVVVFLATPVIVVVSLLVVAAMMTPSMLALVAERRFPQLEKKHGGSFWAGAAAALGATLLALLALVLSVPFWLIPPLVLVLPPLVWGWLSYRVMSYDVLAEHASSTERRRLLRRHRTPLLLIGVLTGYLGAAPSLVWASGVVFLALAPVLVPLAIWIYTLVFAFSSLWFAHYALAALQQLRADNGQATTVPLPTSPAAAAPAAVLPPSGAIHPDPTP